MKARDVKGTKSDRIVEQKGRILPKKVFAKYNLNDERTPFLEIEEDIEALAEKGEMVYIGEYQLVNVRKVELKLRIG